MHRYDDLLAAEEPGFDWPELDERSAAAMCYTSGTTGNPKGVVYSHRSTFLHAMADVQPRLHRRRRERPGARHRAACSTPTPGASRTRAFLAGADAASCPDRYLRPQPLVDFIEAERPTLASAVPTIWAGILPLGAQRDSTCRRCGW